LDDLISDLHESPQGMDDLESITSSIPS